MHLSPLKYLHIAGAAPFASRPNYNQYLNGMLRIVSAMSRFQDIFHRGDSMGVHGGEWRVHASAVDDIQVIEDSLAWLSGDITSVSTHKDKSALGAPMFTIISKMTAKQSIFSLGRLQSESVKRILDSGFGSRIDEDKFLHLRIDLDALCRGEGEISVDKNAMVAKGRFKLEVYPRQSVNEVAMGIFLDLRYK